MTKRTLKLSGLVLAFGTAGLLMAGVPVVADWFNLDQILGCAALAQESHTEGSGHTSGSGGPPPGKGPPWYRAYLGFGAPGSGSGGPPPGSGPGWWRAVTSMPPVVGGALPSTGGHEGGSSHTGGSGGDSGSSHTGGSGGSGGSSHTGGSGGSGGGCGGGSSGGGCGGGSSGGGHTGGSGGSGGGCGGGSSGGGHSGGGGCGMGGGEEDSGPGLHGKGGPKFHGGGPKHPQHSSGQHRSAHEAGADRHFGGGSGLGGINGVPEGVGHFGSGKGSGYAFRYWGGWEIPGDDDGNGPPPVVVEDESFSPGPGGGGTSQTASLASPFRCADVGGKLKLNQQLSERNTTRINEAQLILASDAASPDDEYREHALLANFQQEMLKPSPDPATAGTYLGVIAHTELTPELVKHVCFHMCIPSADTALMGEVATNANMVRLALQ